MNTEETGPKEITYMKQSASEGVFNTIWMNQILSQHSQKRLSISTLGSEERLRIVR